MLSGSAGPAPEAKAERHQRLERSQIQAAAGRQSGDMDQFGSHARA